LLTKTTKAAKGMTLYKEFAYPDTRGEWHRSEQLQWLNACVVACVSENIFQ